MGRMNISLEFIVFTREYLLKTKDSRLATRRETT
jgi:hypothetical protein